MSLFHFNYDRPGPGVEKDEPQKKGIFRWWEIFVRDFSALFFSNLLFVLCALPVLLCTAGFYITCLAGAPWLLLLVGNLVGAVLLGPALAAMHRLTLQMCRDVPFFTWHEFKKAFKTDFKQGAVTMVLLMLLADVLMFNTYVLLSGGKGGMFFTFMLVLGIYIWFSLLNTMFQQIALMELPLRTIFKNSVLLVVAAGWRGVLMVLIDMVLLLVTALYGILLVPLYVFGFFSFTLMTTNLIFWPRFNELFITRKIERPEHHTARQDWEQVAQAEDVKAAREGEEKKRTADQEWAAAFLADTEDLEETEAAEKAAAASADALPEAPEETDETKAD